MIESLMLRHLKGFTAQRILDVGPGYGAFSRVAASATGATSVTYIDCNADVLAWQAAECSKGSLSAECLHFPLERNALRDALSGSYDVILCQELLEHMVNAEEIAAVLAGKLSRGGRMVVTVPTMRSERWLKRIYPQYMESDPYGHVRQFDEPGLRALLEQAGLRPLVLIPTQPHFFVAHTWLCGTRMKVEESTGRILTRGIRGFLCRKLFKLSKALFSATGWDRWGRLLPRSYFVVAQKA